MLMQKYEGGTLGAKNYLLASCKLEAAINFSSA